MTVQVLLAGTSTRAHKQRHSGQGKKQQALHRFLLGLESRVLTLSAVGDCLGDKGLNGLLAPTTRPRLVQAYLSASDACCPPCVTCRPR
jgi:hypothetical protein